MSCSTPYLYHNKWLTTNWITNIDCNLQHLDGAYIIYCDYNTPFPIATRHTLQWLKAELFSWESCHTSITAGYTVIKTELFSWESCLCAKSCKQCITYVQLIWQSRGRPTYMIMWIQVFLLYRQWHFVFYYNFLLLTMKHQRVDKPRDPVRFQLVGEVGPTTEINKTKMKKNTNTVHPTRPFMYVSPCSPGEWLGRINYDFFTKTKNPTGLAWRASDLNQSCDWWRSLCRSITHDLVIGEPSRGYTSDATS